MEEGASKKNGELLSKVRSNPWILSTIVLGVFLVLALAFAGNSTSVSVSEDDVADKVVGFLNQQVDGGVELQSIDKKGSYYELMVGYQGDVIPIQATLDGDYLITDLVAISTAGNLAGDPSLTGNAVSDPVDVEAGDSPVKGKVNAPVTIIEFSDYECPFCERFYTQTFSLIDENYIKTGKVKLVYRDFPLSFHQSAQKAAEAARCFREQKGDEGYFRYHNKIFENQQSLSVQNFKVWAKELGANSAQFDTCLDSGKYYADVQADATYGAQVGVTGTPGFFINGIRVSGAQPYSVFEQIIEAELAKV